MYEHDTFARMRRRGGRDHDDSDYDLDAAFAQYAHRFATSDGDAPFDAQTDVAAGDRPPAGDRWSTWDASTAGERGPEPRPPWVVTELAAVDTELGVLKTGKEADVSLVERAVPDGGPATLMAAKRYRDAQHRMFHRDAGYLEGRRDKESRVNRAVAKRTAFGKSVIATQWANAEFTALCRFWESGVSVPYPVQIVETELLMEFVGSSDGTAADRLAARRPSPEERDDLWEQLRQNLSLIARHGLTHGDLSAYNILVHGGRLVIIDVPQIIDVVANPNGPEYLERDVRNVGAWFVARGLRPDQVDELVADLTRESLFR